MAKAHPRTVLVTGASSGIGRALALAYAKTGARVAVTARREPELRTLETEIVAAGGRAVVLPCDVSDADAALRVVNDAADAMGSLEMVVANAGVGGTKPAHRLTVEDAVRILDVNTRGAVATLVAAIPIMLEQKRGHLVGVSSLAGRRALPGVGTYNASKAALSSFLETLHLDLAPIGLHVTDVQAGFVATPMTAKAKHPMPFQWSAEETARYLVRRLTKGPRVIAFPWQLDLLTRLSRLLPYVLYAPLTRKVTAKG